MKKQTLSDKRKKKLTAYGSVAKDSYYYPEEDVKDFIKQLKDVLQEDKVDTRFIDKLAGEQLTK